MPGVGRNGTRLVVEPTEGVRPLLRAIDAAHHTIFLEAYILTQRRVERALQRAAAQGVAVYVLLDSHPFGMGNQPAQMASSLQSAGIAVRWTSPRFYYTHAKFLVVDDTLAVISTANFSTAAFSKNREFLVFDRQRADVHDLSNTFRSDWDRIPFENRNPALIISPRSRPELTILLQRSRHFVDVYAEEVADPGLDRLLVQLHRHVRVRVLLADTYRSPGLNLLLKEGVAVHGMRYPYIHAKMFLVDGRYAFIGSENLSPTSLDLNREVGIVLRGAAVERALTIFHQDWVGSSVEGMKPLK